MRIRSSVRFTVLTFAFLATAFRSAESFAKFDDRDDFSVHEALSDGRYGPRNSWEHRVDESPVASVSAELQRDHGTRETVCTLGFSGGRPFEPREMEIDQNHFHTVTWNVGGDLPRGRPLLMSCRGGKVSVKNVTVIYTKHPDHRGNGYGYGHDHDRGYDDRDDHWRDHDWHDHDWHDHDWHDHDWRDHDDDYHRDHDGPGRW